MKRILVADDDAAICDSVRMILEDEGYSVDTTVDSRTISKMRNNFPDLLLLDIWMSGVDGRDIAKHLKSKSSTKNLPIMLFSASCDIEQSAKEAGADEFLAKPFKMDDLLSKIKKLID